MKLILIRHGQTVENQKKIMQGHMEGTLSKEGIVQTEKVGLRLKDEKIDAIYSSDLIRAAETAKAIAKYHSSTPLYFTKELREGNKGSITGKKVSEVDWDNLPNDIETKEEMQIRIKRLLDKVYEKHSDDTVVFVGHSGINKAFITLMLNKPAEYASEIHGIINTSLCIFEINDNENTVKLMNCAKHLEN
jgi:probable phosphoglycerate mutase